MTVLPQSELANHDGSYGLLIEVSRPFEHDWHAQVRAVEWSAMRAVENGQQCALHILEDDARALLV